jgi:dihydrodipicolinate synthase/N-acetylneuraminate lyase
MKEKITQLKAKILHGVVPAMATPIQSNGYQVERAGIAPLVNFLIDRGVSGLFVGGTTGEGILLSSQQRKWLYEETITAASGRVPVLLHVGANTTSEAINLADHASSIGASAVVAMTPYFLTVSDEALLDYFSAIAKAAGNTPFFAYDIPQLAVNGVSPKLLQQLSQNIPNFAGLKCSRPDMQMIRQHLDVLPAECCLMVGNEYIALGALAMGATGLISGLSTAVPEPFVALTKAYTAGQLPQAQAIQKQISKMLDVLPANARFGSIKSILNERGIQVGTTIPPRPMPTQPLWPTLEALLP